MGFRKELPQQKRRADIERRLQLDRSALVADLLEGLQGKETEEIASAAEAFAWVRDEVSVPQLVELLGHSDEWVRDRSGYALARMWRTALPCMAEAVDKAQDEKFEHLVRTFVRIGKPAVPQLLDMLQGKTPNQQSLALKALCQIAFPPRELSQLLTTSDDKLLGDAFEILGKSKKTDAIQLLLDHPALGKRSWHKKQVALGKLARYFPKSLLKALQQTEEQLTPKWLIWEALKKAGHDPGPFSQQVQPSTNSQSKEQSPDS